MTRPVNVDLTGVSETMLLPLYARARHTRSARPRFHDHKAVELVERLDYDFSAAHGDRLMSDGVVLRTLTLDRLVGGYIATHPGATVVNLACGLDTRFHRLDDGALVWYDLDLPRVASLRSELLPTGERTRLVAASALDPAWPDRIEAEHARREILVIIEGLTMYLTGARVRELMRIIAAGLPAATVLVEVMPRLFQRLGRERSVSATGARFTYGSPSARRFAATAAPGYELLHDEPFTRIISDFHPWTAPLLALPGLGRASQRIVVLRAPLS